MISEYEKCPSMFEDEHAVQYEIPENVQGVVVPYAGTESAADMAQPIHYADEFRANLPA